MRVRWASPVRAWGRVRGGACAALLLAAVAAAGCTRERELPPDGAATAPDTVVRGPRDVVAVQLAAFADSAAAGRLRDSLSRAGWTAYVREQRDRDTLPPYRVRVMPTPRAEHSRLVAEGFLAAGARPVLVPDVQTPVEPSISLVAVSRGGGPARVRWAASPDRSALLVVADRATDAGEPVPDDFLFVSERGPVQVQRDSVWDVAPSPSWGRLLYGRAYVVSVAGRDSLSVAQWADVAGRTGLELRTVRERAFPIRRSAALVGFAQPVIESTHPDSLRESSLLRHLTAPVRLAGGWRVRWSADGGRIAVGTPGERMLRDDAAPRGWLAVDAENSLLLGELSRGTRLHEARWTEGPRIDAAATMPTGARELPIAGGTVRSEDGWITVHGEITGGEPLVLGPGSPLAATATGQFVLALAPAPQAPAGQPKVRLLVYRVN